MVTSLESVNQSLQRQIRRHIFHMMRWQGRFVLAPIFLSYAVIDYFYSRENFELWLCLRLFGAASMWLAFFSLRWSHIRKYYSQHLSAYLIVLYCNIINLMVFQNDGYKSMYITGLLLIPLVGQRIFRLDRKFTLISSVLSLFPTIVIILSTTNVDEWPFAVTQISFLVGLIIVSSLTSFSEYAVAVDWAEDRFEMDAELKKLNRSEFLKKNFPPQLREEIESGRMKLTKKKVISTAVVGFADIASSTNISNSVDLMTDWEIKEMFLEAASRRATECGLIVLTHTGDGFLFLANYEEKEDWTFNIITFFELLLVDFEKITQEKLKNVDGLKTGVKCGVAMGPAIVGFIGKSQSYFTAMGPEVNLASRLCARAQSGELVVSSRVGFVLKHLLKGWNFKSVVYENLKGFQIPVPAHHIQPRILNTQNRSCPACKQNLTIVKTSEGFIEYACKDAETPQHKAQALSP
ncbi:MAG: adenylate/guanylate cyclase domain-containing protein [Bdellovibrionales bacterium]